jgi:hypothetical protein
VSLDPIKKRRKLQEFDCFDIETTTDLTKVYLVGWYDGTKYLFWESLPLPPEHPDSAISKFLLWRFSTPTRRPQYAHNGGNFDAVFALASIIALFPNLTVELIPSQSSILLMKVTDKQGHSWEFRDSARTLPDSLDNLAQCFLGERKMEIDDYKTLHNNPHRYEYLHRDCTLLYGVLSRFFRLLHDKLGGSAGISAASTALATFRTSYQRRPLPSISKHAEGLARAGYYGGRCEPFRREFISDREHPLHCYDVNSMYPWAMRQPQPIAEVDIDGFHPELCGFIDCTVEVSDCHVPILPCRAKNRLLFPVGRWRGVFSTAELRAAMDRSQAQVVRFYDAVYFRTADIFSDYVDTLYKFRNKNDPDWELSLDRMAKISLNSLYGKFGSQEVRETIHIRPDFNDMVDKQMQQMPSPLSTDCYIERTVKHSDYMLPQISAWITALGRVKLAEALLAVGNSCFYCDTDSVYTDESMREGSSLGEWKDEYNTDPIVYAYFLSPKVYVLRHGSGKTTNKAKGFSRFGKHNPLPPNAVAILAAGEGLEVSRFAKARSVIRGDFGLMIAQKRCHMDYEKRIFHNDGTSEPRRVDE